MGETEVRPRYSLLGPLRVWGPDGTTLPLGGRRPRELLALLLIHPNEVVSRERLVDALWGATASDGATTTLRTHVGAVRRVLESAGARDALKARSGGYRLELDRDEIDAELFERLVARGQEALGLGDHTQANALLARALGLWDGEVLVDLGPPDFAATTTARLDELRLVAEEAFFAAELALGRHREAVHRLQALVAAHPFRERFVGQLMVALYRSGRQADALAAYAATKASLGEELGLDPGPELQSLETALLRQDPLLDGFGTGAPDRAPAPRSRGSQPPDAVLAALRRTPIVGRPGELRTLETRWESVVAGGAAIALVSGPAGIGKSRLVAELAHRAAEDDAVVMVARCDDASLPYQPLAAALRASGEVAEVLHDAPGPVRERLAPLLPDDAEPGRDGNRSELLSASGWLLGELAGSAPVLLAVEEGERIDPATATLLRQLGRRLPARVMLVIAYRDPPGSLHPPLLELVGDATAAALADRLALHPLGIDDLAVLMSGLAGAEPDARFVERLWERTGGNPFFATEVLRDLAPSDLAAADLADAVPVAVRDVLRHRLVTLPTDTREAVTAAAVLGLDVEVLLLGRVLDWHEEELVPALEPAVARGFLVESGRSWAGGYAFPHDLMRAAVYAEAPRPRREQLHRRAAEALLAVPAPADADLMAAAVHLRQAGAAVDPPEAGRASLRASEAAARSLAWAEAVEHAEAALPFLDRGAPPEEQAEARVGLAMLHLTSGHDHARALALLEDALARQIEHGDTLAAGTTHSRIGGALSMHHTVMDIPRALEHFDAAERLRPGIDEKFLLHRGRMQAGMFGVRTDMLGRAADRAGEIAGASGRDDLLAYAAWGAAYHAANRGEITVAFDHFARAWRYAQPLGDAYLAWWPASGAAHVATELLLDPTAGRAWCRRGLAQPRFAAFAHPHEAVVDQLVRSMAVMGELDAARHAAEPLPDGALAHRVLDLYRGEWERVADDAAASLARDRAAGSRHEVLFDARRLADVLTLLGDTDRAVGVLDDALLIAVDGPQVPSEVWVRARLAQLGAPGDEEHVLRCEEIVTHDGWAGLRGEVALARARVDARWGRPRGARAAFEDAVAAFTRYRLPWRQAEVHLAWALLDPRQRDLARAVYARIGAGDRWLSRCDAGSTRTQRAPARVGP
ncbi:MULTISPECIES: BTAD domain-containing putative transcriptional regulator [unclassified Nocardioides]|uniref:BTAD domain-containing putative transcriptional regulator n=1 Tax=unclassified Nocardioides TaxID=2615069 RepID=UPI0036102D67